MIVILEDNIDRQQVMRECLSHLDPEMVTHFFVTAADAICWLKLHLKETVLIGLDHDLEFLEAEGHVMIDPGTGRDVADFLATQKPVCPVIINTTNIPAGIGMEMTLKEAGWKTERLVPYGDMEWIPESWLPTVQRLLSSVRQL
jgi:hypothetical protein